jgi:hypothetical protein
MAGNGPAPKDKSQRRRANEPARGEWVDLLPLEEPVLPPLPERAGDEDWSPMTVATWEAWRCDPVTAQYTPADIAYALDTIRLYDAMTPSSANEVRLRMDGLGLTPKGKKDLRWRVVEPADDAPRRRGASRSGVDRRARLSVVK